MLNNEASYHSPDPLVRYDVDASLDHLRGMDSVDSSRLGVMGVCMSGRYPIVVNAYRDDLAALVMFYGGANRRGWGVDKDQPEPFADLVKRISAPVLCVFGERDANHPVPDVLNLRNELEDAGKSYDMKIYRDMPHGWLNSRMPGRYRAEGAKLAWRHLMDFLDRVYSGGYPKDRKHWNFNGDVVVDYDPSKYPRLA